MAGRLLLLVEVGQQVVGGPLVEAGQGHPFAGLGRGQRPHLPDELAHRLAELGRPAQGVALPEREPAGQAGRRRDQHLVVRDVLDAPARGPQGEDVAHPRLVDHLLVELTDPSARTVAAGEEHAVEAAVGDRPARGDGEPLRAAAAGEDPGHAVPHHPRSQLGELVAGVATGQHVEHRLQHRPRQPRERRRSPDQGLEVVDRPVVHRAHGDDLLGEHVERVRGDPHRLDRAGAHPLHDDGGLDQVAAELREQHPARHGAHLVAGPADPLQTAAHARRRLHLDDEVDRAHVDAELQAARRDDRGQQAALERVLDLGPLLLADRAVVGAGEHRRRSRRGTGLRHQLGRSAGMPVRATRSPTRARRGRSLSSGRLATLPRRRPPPRPPTAARPRSR